jgi:hypothetical protein
MRNKSTTIKDKLPKVTHEGGSMAMLEIMANREEELITQLRNEVRQDMKDYKLLTTDKHIGTELSERFLFGEGDRSCLRGVRSFFYDYLDQQIDNNLTKLKKLIEVNNNEK